MQSVRLRVTADARASMQVKTGQGYTLPCASEETLGGVKVGSGLFVTQDGVLSVQTAQRVEADNTLPVTSAAVYMELGNVEALLKNI